LKTLGYQSLHGDHWQSYIGQTQLFQLWYRIKGPGSKVIQFNRVNAAATVAAALFLLNDDGFILLFLVADLIAVAIAPLQSVVNDMTPN